MPEMPIEDINNLDEVVRELGIGESFTTPAEAVRKLKAENERLIEELQDAQSRGIPLSHEVQMLRTEVARLTDELKVGRYPGYID